MARTTAERVKATNDTITTVSKETKRERSEKHSARTIIDIARIYLLTICCNNIFISLVSPRANFGSVMIALFVIEIYQNLVRNQVRPSHPQHNRNHHRHQFLILDHLC